jgi:hypothetical protein
MTAMPWRTLMKKSAWLVLVTAIVTCGQILASRIRVVMGEEPKAQRAEALPKYGFDPSTPLETRIGETSPAVLKEFRDGGATRRAPPRWPTS